jgi:hypothetical protein
MIATMQPDRLLAGFKGVLIANLENQIMTSLIPIVAIIMGIAIAMLGMWTEHQRKSQLLEQQHRERMAAIEKGIELPPITPETSANTSSNTGNVPNPARVLRIGVFLLSLGFVLYYALDTVGAGRVAVFGLIPATLGLANLAYAAVLFNSDRKG